MSQSRAEGAGDSDGGPQEKSLFLGEKCGPDAFCWKILRPEQRVPRVRGSSAGTREEPSATMDRPRSALCARPSAGRRQKKQQKHELFLAPRPKSLLFMTGSEYAN